ncbi:MAG: alkaline phosphatase D [Akkermansiaceae bacterium]|jgi:alkaline phosphatase D
MKVQRPTVGPIVGGTESTRARIWIRAEYQTEKNDPRRAFGVIRHRKKGTSTWRATQLFKMNPNFDMTGIAILNKLPPRTRCEYQVGYFWSNLDFEDINSQFSNSDWESAASGIFRTSSDRDSESRTLAIGSCRYFLKLFGGSFFDQRGDKTFRSIVRQIESGNEINQLIMMGDQIYADDLNIIAPDRTVHKFFERYREAFGQPHLRRLMANVPTYMMMDDHEIENDWPAEANHKDWKVLYPAAAHAYQTYQASHSPLLEISGDRLVGVPKRWWYQYTDGCCDFFVLDCRTERWIWDLENREKLMIGKDQMKTLKRWLADGSGRAKIIVSSIPFFPDATSESSDKWSGFPEQRKEILTHIESKKISKVVFFSGDVHSSFSAQLTSPSGLKIHSVVSSAFFWPYPHPHERDFKITGTIDGGAIGSFKITDKTKVISDDNFTRVKVTTTGISTEVFERKGKKIQGLKKYTW